MECLLSSSQSFLMTLGRKNVENFLEIGEGERDVYSEEKE